VTTDEDRVAERTAEWLGIALPVETPLFSGRRPDRFRKATEREATPQSAKRVEKGLVLPQEGMNRTSCLAGAPRRPQHLGTPGAPVRTAKLHPAEKSASRSAIREHPGNHERHIVKLRSTVNESADTFHEAVVDLLRYMFPVELDDARQSLRTVHLPPPAAPASWSQVRTAIGGGSPVHPHLGSCRRR
jgi:hypothetical protein